MSELHDAPNQQVVRPDGSAPWEEGEGGSSQPEGTPTQAEEPAEVPAGEDYAAMTKADLISLAQSRGISPANNDMTKDELIAALEAG